MLNAERKPDPYTFRFESAARGSRRLYPDLGSASAELPEGAHASQGHRVRPWPTASGLEATALPGRVIIYREARNYGFGEVIAWGS